jgi:hypothetical protein
MRPRQRITSHGVIAVLVLAVAAIVVTATYARTRSHAHIVRPVAARPATTPFGPATRAVRDAWAAVLRCEYARGATKKPIEGNSFEVVGLTADIKAACAGEQQAADQAMADPAYASERAALGIFMRDVWSCVSAKGVAVGQDTGRDDHQPEPAGAPQAFAACKQQLEAARGLQEPAPLP